jgi:hypothetical protein
MSVTQRNGGKLYLSDRHYVAQQKNNKSPRQARAIKY